MDVILGFKSTYKVLCSTESLFNTLLRSEATGSYIIVGDTQRTQHFNMVETFQHFINQKTWADSLRLISFRINSIINLTSWITTEVVALWIQNTGIKTKQGQGGVWFFFMPLCHLSAACIYYRPMLVCVKAFPQLLNLVSRVMMCFVTQGQERCWDVKHWLEWSHLAARLFPSEARGNR